MPECVVGAMAPPVARTARAPASAKPAPPAVPLRHLEEADEATGADDAPAPPAPAPTFRSGAGRKFRTKRAHAEQRAADEDGVAPMEEETALDELD